MLRLLYLLTRRDDVTPDEFIDHLSGHHVTTHGQPVDALRRYVLYRGTGDDCETQRGREARTSRHRTPPAARRTPHAARRIVLRDQVR